MRVPLEWLKEFVDIRKKPEALSSALTMCGLEVESIELVDGEPIFEIGIAPNRADCLSVVGIARELSAVTGGKFRAPSVKVPRGSGKIRDRIQAQVKDSRRCPRYLARIIDGITIGPSPAWIVERLAACGIRSINNVVDVTNYVMLELGQPLHAFDLRFIRDGKIVIQTVGKIAHFKTLDDVERELEADDLLICDGKGPVALAGIMGGENSEVRDSTTAVLLESAFFEPSGVRRASRRLGISSESSRRFERGIDPNGSLLALHRLTEIIIETAGGTPTVDWFDIYPRKILPRRIDVSEAETNRILGAKLKTSNMAKVLMSLGFSVSRAKKHGVLTVVVPTFRPDVERPIDLIEEVARGHGYHNIPETMPMMRAQPLSRPKFFNEECKVRQVLVNAGLSETVLYGFMSENSLAPFAELGMKALRITNPLSSEQAVMCTTLLPGLLDALKLNISRQRQDCRLFALQRVFLHLTPSGLSNEPRRLAGVMLGRRFPHAWEHAKERIDFYDVKGVVESVIDSMNYSGEVMWQKGRLYNFLHPGISAQVILDNQVIGFVGQFHPNAIARLDVKEEVYCFELDFELLTNLGMVKPPKYVELSRFPFVQRDLALVIPNAVPVSEINKVIKDSGVMLIEGIRAFDVYRGQGVPEGFKSLGVTLKFARSDRTLTEEEVVNAQAAIMEMLKTKLGATLRVQ